MTDTPKKGRGGSRKHPSDCKCGNCPVMGRRKVDRSLNPNVATKVLKEKNVEALWGSLIELEKWRLGIGAQGQLLKRATERLKAEKEDSETEGLEPANFYRWASIIPLMNLLKYLEDRSLGRPMDTVNHIHSKPIEHNVTHTLSERFRIAMEKGEKRVVAIR